MTISIKFPRFRFTKKHAKPIKRDTEEQPEDTDEPSGTQELSVVEEVPSDTVTPTTPFTRPGARHSLYSPNRDLFNLQRDFLDKKDCEALAKYDDLGEDPSMKYYMKRRKSIAFVMLIEGEVFCLKRNYFIQEASYNDFAGGIKRYFDTLPESLVRDHLTKTIHEFARINNLPDRSVILIQLQQSVTPALKTEQKDARDPTDLTGQGIHTDGADRAAIMCIERTNVNGAENSLYADLQGEKVLLSPTVLEEGDALFFQDNSLYHYVSNATPVSTSEDLRRTVVIMHYPAEIYLTGKSNPKNKLNTRKGSVVLRMRPSFKHLSRRFSLARKQSKVMKPTLDRHSESKDDDDFSLARKKSEVMSPAALDRQHSESKDDDDSCSEPTQGDGAGVMKEKKLEEVENDADVLKSSLRSSDSHISSLHEIRKRARELEDMHASPTKTPRALEKSSLTGKRNKKRELEALRAKIVSPI